MKTCKQCGEPPMANDPELSNGVCVYCGYWDIGPGPVREQMRAMRQQCVADAKVVVEEAFGKRQARCTWCRSYIREDSHREQVEHAADCIVTTPIRNPSSIQRLYIPPVPKEPVRSLGIFRGDKLAYELRWHVGGHGYRTYTEAPLVSSPSKEAVLAAARLMGVEKPLDFTE